jgi:hypothetical protein
VQAVLEEVDQRRINVDALHHIDRIAQANLRIEDAVVFAAIEAVSRSQYTPLPTPRRKIL